MHRLWNLHTSGIQIRYYMYIYILCNRIGDMYRRLVMITYIKSIPIHFQLPNRKKKFIGIMFHEFWYCENGAIKNPYMIYSIMLPLTDHSAILVIKLSSCGSLSSELWIKRLTH